jgi:hypothetical protein
MCRVIVRLLLATLSMGWASLDAPAGGEDWVRNILANSGGPTERASGPRHKESTAPSSQNVFTIVGNILGAPIAGTKESVCLNSTLFHVEGFPGDGVFKGADARRLAKSTVRIRITHTRLAEELMERKRRDLRATTFHMGGFSPIAGMDEGICTGTLIAGNVVLTAGHCVSAHYWSVEKGVEFPYFQIGDARSYITERDFAKLLVVDFNYQIDLSPVASIDNLSPTPVRAALRFTVRELVSSAAESNGGLDYAILRIAGAPAQIVDYALGADKLKYTRLGQAVAIAVIQHPFGYHKKIAAGTAVSSDGAMQHTASTAAGSSGAGLLDSRGNLVGVHSEGGCDQGAGNIAIPLSSIKGPLSSALMGRRN